MGGILHTGNVHADYTAVRSASQAKPLETKGPTGEIRGVQVLFELVSPGFEPSQRESKSLVLPLHHETEEGAESAEPTPARGG